MQTDRSAGSVGVCCSLRTFVTIDGGVQPEPGQPVDTKLSSAQVVRIQIPVPVRYI